MVRLYRFSGQSNIFRVCNILGRDAASNAPYTSRHMSLVMCPRLNTFSMYSFTASVAPVVLFWRVNPF